MNKKVYLVAKGLLSAMMLMSAGMYFFNNAEMSKSFEALGYPTYIIIPLAILKIAGIVTLWLSKNKSLTEWAYAGFFFNFLLALTAHVAVNDGEFAPALIALVLLLTTYFTHKKINA